jgi:hypothetical protein
MLGGIAADCQGDHAFEIVDDLAALMATERDAKGHDRSRGKS